MQLIEYKAEAAPVAQYKRAVGTLVAQVDTIAQDVDCFECHISARRVGILQLVSIKSDPLIIRRSVRCISDDPNTQYIIALHRIGRCVIRFENQEIMAEAGTAFLLDKTQPYEVEFLERTERMLVCVSRKDLEHRLYDPDRYLLTIMDTGGGIGRIASNYTNMLFEEAASMDNSCGALAAEICLELLANALASGSPSQGEQEARTGRAKTWLALLSRIKAYIRQNLSNPNLRPGIDCAGARHFQALPACAICEYGQIGWRMDAGGASESRLLRPDKRSAEASFSDDHCLAARLQRRSAFLPAVQGPLSDDAE